MTERLGIVDEEAVTLFGYFGTLLRMLRLSGADAIVERCAKLIDLVPVVAPYNMVDRATLCLVAGRLAESAESASRAEVMLTALGAWQPSLHLDYGTWLAVPGRRAPGRGVPSVRADRDGFGAGRAARAVRGAVGAARHRRVSRRRSPR